MIPSPATDSLFYFPSQIRLRDVHFLEGRLRRPSSGGGLTFDCDATRFPAKDSTLKERGRVDGKPDLEGPLEFGGSSWVGKWVPGAASVKGYY